VKVAIELSETQAQRLREEAGRLGIAPEELARAAVSDLLAASGDDFRRAAEMVLAKNQELYERLS